MKTAVEELIEYIEEFTPKNKTTDGIRSKAKSLIEQEKQQIIDAYEKGTDEGINDGGEDSEKYYNETFKKKL